MPTTPPTTTAPPTTADAWKPSKRQVVAAAQAFARVDDIGWHRLTQAQRDDYQIDAAAALFAAHRIAPVSLNHDGASLVCMTKEHADAYAELFAACETIETALSKEIFPDLREARDRRTRYVAAIDRLRALASPERTTP